MAGEFLRVVRGETEGTEVRVDDEQLLGREVDGAGGLGESAEISRRHARLTRVADGGLLVEDLGSLNGTIVNGERIDRAQRLAVGDTLKVGDALLVVVDAQGRAGQPTAYTAGSESRRNSDTRATSTADGARHWWEEFGDLQLAGIALALLAIAIVVFLLLR